MRTADDVDALLKARAEIDEQLRRHKNALTVLFTDVVGSTSFFERNGDTAGLVMIHRHDELAASAIKQYDGKLVKMIGDSAMAEFPDPASAVHAAVEIEREFHKLNQALPEEHRVEVRIGVHTGIGFRKGDDLFGDVVNVTSRIVKRTAPAQILISRALYEAIADEPELHCRWLSKLTIDGRTEKEDIFEVLWTDAEAYRDVQERVAGASHIPPRYEALSQIGNGGMGIVYKVRDLETSEIVALKILKPEIASDPDVQENFKRELCLARKITHKNVCRIHEFSRSNGTAYASMELVEGETLSARLTRAGALPLAEALEIARQICAGLREAHAQGIVHRDLKPANIMLDRNGVVKIMDFGIARMIQRDGPMTGTIVGTPAYMAPEQAELKPVSACTDIYALGLLLYEMITGVAAFAGDTPVAVALKQIREYPKRPREIVPQLSRAVDSVIMKCLQKDPAKRYQSVESFEVALVKASRARTVSAWEIAVNRALDRAEVEMRTRSVQAFEQARAFLRRQDWGAVTRLQKDPVAMLGVAGLAGAMTVFVFVWGFGYRAINAQASELRGQNPPAPIAAPARIPVTASSTPSIESSPAPISSREVNLYDNAGTNTGREISSAPALRNESLKSETPEPSTITHGSLTLAKHAKPSVRASDAAAQPKPSAPVLSVSGPAVTSSPTPASAAEIAAPEPSVTPAQPIVAPEPAAAEPSAVSESKPGAVDAKAPVKVFFEVGTFKDETWANNAVDKLTQLGFHAVLIHKNVLWVQSYHVQVGPYSDQKAIAEAQQSLASQGYKPHPVN